MGAYFHEVGLTWPWF